MEKLEYGLHKSITSTVKNILNEIKPHISTDDFCLATSSYNAMVNFATFSLLKEQCIKIAKTLHLKYSTPISLEELESLATASIKTPFDKYINTIPMEKKERILIYINLLIVHYYTKEYFPNIDN
jgi:hypothetical protein